MNSNSLDGKTILISGASSGIGKSTAIELSRCKARVIITGRNQKRLKETYNKLFGDIHQMMVADLSKAEDIENLTSQLPSIDGVVHSAGITNHRPAQFIKTKNIEEVFNINFNAPVLITSQILKQKKLKKNGSIVFISSVAAQNPYFGGSLYVSSKAALEGYAKALSLELASKGIRSNCISPGYVKTAMIESSEIAVSKEVMDRVAEGQLLGEGQPLDVAHTIVFLLSDQSKWITGTNIKLGG